jgi:hypothetical protein
MRQRIAEWLGFYVVDAQAVGRALAEDVLREFEGVTLERAGTERLLRSRYLRLVANIGLPSRALEDVVACAWATIRRTHAQIVAGDAGFSFYD